MLLAQRLLDEVELKDEDENQEGGSEPRTAWQAAQDSTRPELGLGVADMGDDVAVGWGLINLQLANAGKARRVERGEAAGGGQKFLWPAARNRNACNWPYTYGVLAVPPAGRTSTATLGRGTGRF